MHRRDDGSGTVLVLGIIGVVAALLIGALALVSAATASSRARTAADLGALAAAEHLVAAGPAASCALARKIIRTNGGRMQHCTTAGSDVVVEVESDTSWPGLGPARARSRAGPAPGLLTSSAG